MPGSVPMTRTRNYRRTPWNKQDVKRFSAISFPGLLLPDLVWTQPWYARQNDCFVVWRLDRLGRSLKNLIQLVEDLDNKGVGFISLNEGLDTTTNGGKLIFHIFGALAEFERNLIRERTKAGLEAARVRGRKGGRKEKLTSDQVDTMRRMYESHNHTIKEICGVLGITKPTFYRYLKVDWKRICQEYLNQDALFWIPKQPALMRRKLE